MYNEKTNSQITKETLKLNFHVTAESKWVMLSADSALNSCLKTSFCKRTTVDYINLSFYALESWL